MSDNLFSFFEISLTIGLCHSRLTSYPNLSVPNDDIWNSIIKIQVYVVLKKNIQTQERGPCVSLCGSPQGLRAACGQSDPGVWIPASLSE